MPRTTFHLLTTADLEPTTIQEVFQRADRHRNGFTSGRELRGRITGLLFFQASTRTRLGFNAAILRLGGQAAELLCLKETGDMSQAESLTDTVQAIGSYLDLIVLRHSDAATLAEVAPISPVPLINGGCGQTEHPTQALIDLYALYIHFKDLRGLRIGLVGNLSESRSALSFLRLICHYDPKRLRLMAPQELLPCSRLLAELPDQDVEIMDTLTCQGLDVLYVAGFPPGQDESRVPREVRAKYSFTAQHLQSFPQPGVILCPLPRVDEIETEVDRSPQAFYFQQSALGLFVRMAILEQILSPLSTTE